MGLGRAWGFPQDLVPLARAGYVRRGSVEAWGNPPGQGMSEHLVHSRFFDELGAGFPGGRGTVSVSHVLVSEAEV